MTTTSCPRKWLGELFRGKFVNALKEALQHGQLHFHGDLKLLAQPKTFAAWLLPLYTHRVAISNHRLVSFADGQVTFRWRDSAHRNEQRLLTLSLDEFLRRFLLHILSKGFVRIRNFGFLANRKRDKLLPLCFHFLGETQQPQVESHVSGTQDSPQSHRCPKCGGPMRVIERFSAAELQLRSPPKVTAAA